MIVFKDDYWLHNILYCDVINAIIREISTNDYTLIFIDDPNVLECKDKMINEI